MDRRVVLGCAGRVAPDRTGDECEDEEPFSLRNTPSQALYTTYLASDDRPVLLGALEPKFWRRFCEGIGREDLIAYHDGAEISFGEDDSVLRTQLETEFAKATSNEWLQRFIDWDVPGGPVYDVPAIMQTQHFADRKIAEGKPGDWPLVTTAVRWLHSDIRAGSGLGYPPDFNEHESEIRNDWLRGEAW